MSRICISFFVLGLLATTVLGQEGKPKKAKGKFTIGKETTYLTGPLTKDGYIDYATALNERLRRGVTPANNAKVLVWKVIGPQPQGEPIPAAFFKWLGIAEPPKKGKYFLGMFRHMQRHREIDPVRDVQDLLKDFEAASERPWKSAQYPIVTGWMHMNEEPLAVLLAATKRSHYFAPLVWAKGEPSGLIYSMQKCRELAYFLNIRVMWHLGEGRYDDAWQDLLTLHRLGRLVGRGGTFIEGLVGMVIDHGIAGHADLVFLDRAKLDTKRIKEGLRDLQALPPMPTVADRIDLAQRFMFLDTVMMVNRYGVKYFEGMKGAWNEIPEPLARRMLDEIDWDPVLRNANRWYDRLAATLRVKDRGARQKQLEQIEQELKKITKNPDYPEDLAKLVAAAKQTPEARSKLIGDILISLLMSGVRKVLEVSDRSEQVHRNLHVAFALAAYQRDHGRYPAKLDALAPKYLAQIPQDLFSGKALIYRPSEKGYLLYSVGNNGIDEGGRWFGEGGDDPRVRMPLP